MGGERAGSAVAPGIGGVAQGHGRHPRPITGASDRTRTGSGYATARRSYGLAARTRRLAGRGRTGTNARPPTRSPARRRTGCGSEREHAARSGRRRAGLAGRRAKQRARRPARRPPLRPCRPAQRTLPASDHGNPHRPLNLSQGPSRRGASACGFPASPARHSRAGPVAPSILCVGSYHAPRLGGPAPRAAFGVGVGGARGGKTPAGERNPPDPSPNATHPTQDRGARRETDRPAP